MIGVSTLAFRCIFIHTTISDETAKTRFTSLRDSYVKKKREMLKKSKSGRGTDPSAELSPVKSYKWYKYLQFLDHVTEEIKSDSNLMRGKVTK